MINGERKILVHDEPDICDAAKLDYDAPLPPHNRKTYIGSTPKCLKADPAGEKIFNDSYMDLI